MKYKNIYIGLLAASTQMILSGGISAANEKLHSINEEVPTVKVELLPINGEEDRCVERFVVNFTDSVERLCFTQLPRGFKAVSAGDSLIELNAGYYALISDRFGKGEKDVVIDVDCEWPLRTVAELPESFYAITPGGQLMPVALHDRPSMTDVALRDRNWSKWMISADSLYRLNEQLSKGSKPGPFDIAPSFKKVTLSEGVYRQGEPVETSLIAHENPEYYRITLQPGKALIEGASEKALVMGKRMLNRRLLEPNGGLLPCAVIEDWPDYPYRGLMIDIARNFQNPETMREIVDLMADYRFNRLHFHITDDEAWRLDIPGLPELTDIGGRRGYTTDSQDYLPEIFAGTGDPNNNLPTAHGFFSRQDFIDFIRYCDALGISVIPEVESPGHARAAIKAMEARHRKGDDTYRLIEDCDTSAYTSAQLYHDNLMNPALPGTYRFISKVVDEIAAMYKDAGVELIGIHLGGDEVPEGAWDGSPSAVAMSGELGLTSRHDMQGEYVKRIANIMRERGIPLYGWQDICTDYDEAFHEDVAPIVGGMNCWVSPHDPEKNVAIKGVKAGYPVIISNVDYFYMDMLYTKHPDERGLFWGGIVDELRALSGYPSKICPPQENQKGKVIGLSGQLFAETIRNPEGMEVLLFPKCLGLAERGWNAAPTYTDADFNILIGEKELPRLERLGVAWHLRQPGIMVKGGEIHMNSPYPDAEILYTIDGTIPALIGSGVYTNPFAIPAGAKVVKAILVKDGKTSVATTLPISH